MAWTTPRDWTDGELVTEALLDTHVRDNLKALTEWTTYTPLWTATGGTPTIGNGTLTGRYLTAGDLCHFAMLLVVGSTTSIAGTSAWTFAAPVPTQAGTSTIFHWFAYDTSSYTAAYGAAPIGGAVSDFQCYNVGVAQSLGASTPFTWATGDSLVVRGTYEC